MSGSTARGIAVLVLSSVANVYVRFVSAGESPGNATAAECSTPLSSARASSSPEGGWKSAACALLPPPFRRISSWSVSDGQPSSADLGSSPNYDDASTAVTPFVYLLCALVLADGIVAVLKHLRRLYKHRRQKASLVGRKTGTSATQRSAGEDAAEATLRPRGGEKGTGVGTDGPLGLTREQSADRHPGDRNGRDASPPAPEPGAAQRDEEETCRNLESQLQQLRAELASACKGGTANFVAQAKLQRRIIRLEQQLADAQKQRKTADFLEEQEHQQPDKSFLTKFSGLGGRNSTLVGGLESAAAQLGNRLAASVAASLFKAVFCYAVVSLGCQWSGQREVAQNGWTLMLPTRFLWPFAQNRPGSQWSGFGFLVSLGLGRLAVDALYGQVIRIGCVFS
uniref:Transmembrane protein n=1 Tax=Neospora caninum (strain Liverpool) TaxID=572307 RepID=A0A0F7UBP4_NEOCL|nr:TPA: hypothetical protein BN1204_016640 [Neospora caninum Liverpool]